MGKNKNNISNCGNTGCSIKNYPISLWVGFPLDRYLMFIAVVATVYSAYDYIIKNANVIDFNK